MSKAASASPSPSLSTVKTPEDTTKHIQKRRSQELIIGLCGAIGSGVKALKDTLQSKLQASGYTVHHIRISDNISAINGNNFAALTGYDRYKNLQDAGDSLRKLHKSAFFAEVAINEITIYRDAHFGTEGEDPDIVKTNQKVAYIIDQLKHPDEIDLLRTVYPNNFYQVALIRTEKERRVNLGDEQIEIKHIDELIRRDRKADHQHGQQVEKALYNADYFIRNIANQSKLMEASVSRLLSLIHGQGGITPTYDEIGLFTAYSESLKSACLSRQVGHRLWMITDKFYQRAAMMYLNSAAVFITQIHYKMISVVYIKSVVLMISIKVS